jgi:MFS family permease
LMLVSALKFIWALGLCVLSFATPVYFNEHFHLGYDLIGIITMLASLAVIPIVLWLGRFSKNVHATGRAFAVLLPIFMLASVMTPLSSGVFTAAVFSSIAAITSSAAGPLLDALVGGLAPRRSLPIVVGIMDTMMKLGWAAGSLIFGLWAGMMGVGSNFYLVAALAPLMALIVACIGIRLSGQETATI